MAIWPILGIWLIGCLLARQETTLIFLAEILPIKLQAAPNSKLLASITFNVSFFLNYIPGVNGPIRYSNFGVSGIIFTSTLLTTLVITGEYYLF